MKRRLKQIATFSCCVAMMLSFPAHAERAKMKTLTHFGESPFLGTSAEGCTLMADKYGVDYISCVSSFERCTDQRIVYLEDGTVIQTMFTNKKTGKHGTDTFILELVYQDGPSKGQSLPADHPDRIAKVCGSVNDSGGTYLLPICDNPSMAVIVLPEEIPVETKEPPVTKQVTIVTKTIEICEPDTVVYTSSPGYSWSTPGTMIDNCCNCQGAQYVPGQSQKYPGTQGFFTKKGKCRNVTIEEEIR